MKYKLYTLDGNFIKEIYSYPSNFTGIIENDYGTKYWKLNNKYHREDGPAIEGSDGSKSWFIDDKLHRLDRPAIEYSYGVKHWFINDKQISMEQHKLYVDLLKLKGLM